MRGVCERPHHGSWDRPILLGPQAAEAAGAETQRSDIWPSLTTGVDAQGQLTKSLWSQNLHVRETQPDPRGVTDPSFLQMGRWELAQVLVRTRQQEWGPRVGLSPQ